MVRCEIRVARRAECWDALTRDWSSDVRKDAGPSRERSIAGSATVLTGREAIANERRSRDVPLGRRQLGTLQALKMRRLGEDEKLVDGPDLEIRDDAEIHSHTDRREEIHGLLGVDRARVLEHSIGAPDFVFDHLALVFDVRGTVRI